MEQTVQISTQLRFTVYGFSDDFPHSLFSTLFYVVARLHVVLPTQTDLPLPTDHRIETDADRLRFAPCHWGDHQQMPHTSEAAPTRS